MKTREKMVVIMGILFLIGSLLGCSDQTETKVQEPDITQIRNICNLATQKCYYHNVAMSVKESEKGIIHLGEKDRKFWIEYTGIANLGIDMSKVQMKVNGADIEVTIPNAELLSISIDEETLDENSYISSEDGLNKNEITADDQTEAIYEAQQKMEETVQENSALLLSAQNRAKILIENYLNQLGETAGVEYNIQWIYLDGGEKVSDVSETSAVSND